MVIIMFKRSGRANNVSYISLIVLLSITSLICNLISAYWGPYLSFDYASITLSGIVLINAIRLLKIEKMCSSSKK